MRFERTPDGFVLESTTRSWQSMVVLPFTALWIWIPLQNRPALEAQLSSWKMSIFFVPATAFLLSACAMSLWGRLRLIRSGSRFSVFTGIGPLGWTRMRDWSTFRSVGERVQHQGEGIQGQIVLEGAERISFGGQLTDERRFYVREVLRRELKREK